MFKIVIYFFSVNYRANSTSKYIYIYIAFMQQPFHAGFWIGRDDPLSELLHDVKANKKGEPIFFPHTGAPWSIGFVGDPK